MSAHVLKDKRLITVMCVTLMSILGVSSVSSSLPTISRGLGFPIEHVGLVMTFFTLPGIFFTPISGMLSDRYGRKAVLIPSLLLFCGGGLACSFAESLPVLLALRMVQGLGAAPLGALNTAMVADMFTGKDRAAAMGFNASALSLGTALFPALGGLVAIWGWNKPFLLPLFALPVAFACLKLPLPGGRDTGNFGAYIKSTFSTLRRRDTVLLMLMPLLSFCITFGPMMTFYPVLSDMVFHQPAHMIGIVYASTSISAMLVAAMTERLVTRFGSARLLLAAPFFFAVGVFSVPHMPGFYWTILPLFVIGIGQGLTIPNIQLLLVQIAPAEQRGVIMSLFSWMLRIGQTLGPLFATLMFTGWGIRAVFHYGLFLAMGLFALALLLQRAAPKRPAGRR